jgi:hypothetical protein
LGEITDIIKLKIKISHKPSHYRRAFFVVISLNTFTFIIK